MNILINIKNTIKRGMIFMSELITGNGGKIELKNLAVNYASCIVTGYKTFAKSPSALKSDIAVALIIWGYEDLVTIESYVDEAKQRIAEAETNM